MVWSASTYLQFKDERTRPARDLLDGVKRDDIASAVDLGCGPGNSTELLVARFAQADIRGLDSDDDMLAAARRHLPDIAFDKADLATWMPPAPVDLLFANAVLQWLPNHLDVMDRLMDALTPGGILAVQMPDNLTEPTHLMMEETLHDGPWAAPFAGRSLRRNLLPPPNVYRVRLQPKASSIETWRTVYCHPMENAAAIVSMVRSTGLRPYLAAVGDAHAAAFLAAYEKRIAAAYPPGDDGKPVLLFPRFFLVARKAG